MLSPELPFRQNEIAIGNAFPLSRGVLSLVIEAPTEEAADSAATRLSKRLSERSDRFRTVFYPEGLAFFRQNGLLYLSIDELESVADRLAEAQPLLSSLNADPTLRGLNDVLALAIDQADAEAAAALAPALGRMAEAVEGMTEGNTRPLSWQSLMSGAAPDSQSKRKFILLQPVRDFGSLEPVSAALAVIAAATQELGLDKDPEIRIRATGGDLMLQEELKTIEDGIGLVGLLSVSFVVILLTLGLRSAKLVAATLITLIVGLICTAAFAVATYKALNLISVAFAVLFIGLSVDFGIHFTLRFREAVTRGLAPRAALATAGDGVGAALALSAVAAALGFLSFLPTAYRGVSELGVISAAGMFIALAANLTLLPALLHLLGARDGDRLSNPSKGPAASPIAALTRHSGKVIAAAAVVFVAAVAALPFARFDDDPLNLRDPKSPSVATLLDLLDDPRAEPYTGEVLVKDIATAAKLAERLKALPEVESATTVRDLVPKDQDDKLAIIEETALVLTPLLSPPASLPTLTEAERRSAFNALRETLARAKGPIAENAARFAKALAQMPETDRALKNLTTVLLGGFPAFRDRLARLLAPEPVALDGIPAPLRDRQLAADGRALVVIKPAEDLRDQDARRRFAAAIKPIVPNASGPPVRFTAVGEAVVGAFQEAAAIGLGLIVVLLFAILRQLRYVLLVLTPLALAMTLTVATTVLLAIPFNLANIIVLPLVLGLGVAFGIQIVMRHRNSDDGALLETSTPTAVVFSALTTIGSFGALALSSHPGTASMGFLLTLAVSLTMLCTLIVLPALLERFGR